MVHVDFQPMNIAANSFDYTEQLGTVVDILGGDTSQIIIHDDNAPIYKSKETKNYYKMKKLSRLTHPRFSPDLAPNDFWLIRKLKKLLANRIVEDAVD